MVKKESIKPTIAQITMLSVFYALILAIVLLQEDLAVYYKIGMILITTISITVSGFMIGYLQSNKDNNVYNIKGDN